MGRNAHTDGQLMEYIWIKPSLLKDYWGLIKPGLMKVQHHGEGWICEDVYAAIKSGTANLHIANVDNEYAGFVVMSLTPSTDGVNLHIWAAYSNQNNPHLLEASMPEFDRWARDAGAGRITFHSPRKGWEKVGTKIGFVPTMTIFERAVS